MEEEKADKLNVPPYEDLNKDYSEEEIKNMINQVIYTDIKSLNNRLKVIEICLKIFWGNNILVKEYKTVFEKIKSKKDCELLNDLMDKIQKDLEMKGLNRKNPFKNIKVMRNFFKNIKYLKKEIKKFDPDIVIGVAGYVTAPVVFAVRMQP